MDMLIYSKLACKATDNLGISVNKGVILRCEAIGRTPDSRFILVVKVPQPNS